MNNIIYNAYGYGVIFFPKGKVKNGGTCEFATKSCLKYCREETNDFMLRAYDFIIKEDIGEVIGRLVKELKALNATLLYWFESGDCEKKHTKRITSIMKGLASFGFMQHGHTRNEKLWKAVKDTKNIWLALTIEVNDVKKLPKDLGLYAVPVYKENYTLYACKYKGYGEKEVKTWVSSCGGSFMSTRIEKYPENQIYTFGECDARFFKEADSKNIYEGNCRMCLNNKRGCFTELEKGI